MRDTLKSAAAAGESRQQQAARMATPTVPTTGKPDFVTSPVRSTLEHTRSGLAVASGSTKREAWESGQRLLERSDRLLASNHQRALQPPPSFSSAARRRPKSTPAGKAQKQPNRRSGTVLRMHRRDFSPPVRLHTAPDGSEYTTPYQTPAESVDVPAVCRTCRNADLLSSDAGPRGSLPRSSLANKSRFEFQCFYTSKSFAMYSDTSCARRA